jgi:cytochrome c553
MRAHQQAVDLMVQGLTVPSALLWHTGAEGLAAEQSVHRLAGRARAATDQRSRIYVYSELVQRCATCHARYGAVAGPDKR